MFVLEPTQIYRYLRTRHALSVCIIQLLVASEYSFHFLYL